MSDVRIIIIAKEPTPGFAKTRLIPALGAQGAAKLADRLLRHTITQALTANLGPVELCVTPDRHGDYWRYWYDNKRIELTQQSNGDLGSRMATAAQQGIESGPPVMLLGTDCPQLDAPTLQAMAASLTEQDACLCPVVDGGYSLLGLRKFDASLFCNIPWSTDQVTALTRDRLRQLGWCWYESDPLWDLDEPDDLVRLQHYPSLSGNIE